MKDITIEEMIIYDEGFRRHPYKDTQDILTIGFGRNLESNGISKEEALLLLRNDINRCKIQLKQYSWYLTQPEPIQNALINMCFNLGLQGLLSFRKMILALIVKDYTKASQEALNSKWATQVPERAKRIALILRNEKYN